MHYTPKKTVEQIIAIGNDYLIAVKANQLKLFHEIARQFDPAPVLRGCLRNCSIDRKALRV
jgi:hypothetical protein